MKIVTTKNVTTKIGLKRLRGHHRYGVHECVCVPEETGVRPVVHVVPSGRVSVWTTQGRHTGSQSSLVQVLRPLKEDHRSHTLVHIRGLRGVGVSLEHSVPAIVHPHLKERVGHLTLSTQCVREVLHNNIVIRILHLERQFWIFVSRGFYIRPS